MNSERNKNKRRLVAGLSLACFMVLGEAEVFAQDEPSVDDVRAAGDEFNLGRAAFKDEDWSTAAEHFEKADSLAPNPKVLLLAIQSRQQAGHTARAATLAALAQDRYPDDSIFTDTRSLITDALANRGKLKVTCAEPCSLMVDSRLVHGQASTKRFLFLDPGSYTIRAEFANGESDRKDFTAEAAGSGKLHFDAVTPSAVEPEAPVDTSDWPEPEPEDGLPAAKITYDSVGEDTQSQPGDGAESGGLPPTVFWIGVGLTAASVGVSTWSGVDAQNNPGPETVERECVGLGESCPAWQDGKDAETRTNILWGVTAGVGLTTILVGALWTDWGPPSLGVEAVSAKRRKREASIEPWLDVDAVAGSGSIGARGRF